MKKIIIKGKYLHKSCIPILYLLLLFLGGCIHQYPDETPTENVSLEMELLLDGVWGIERSGFFNGREKWAKDFENQRV